MKGFDIRVFLQNAEVAMKNPQMARNCLKNKNFADIHNQATTELKSRSVLTDAEFVILTEKIEKLVAGEDIVLREIYANIKQIASTLQQTLDYGAHKIYASQIWAAA